MSKYTLSEYNELAYEFAIRNIRVIELLGKPLTNDSAKEFSAFGIDTEVYYSTGHNTDVNAEEGYEHSLRELNLDYYHLKTLNHEPYTYEELGIYAEEFKGYKSLVHPLKSIIDGDYQEKDIDALNRIEKLLGSYSETKNTHIDSRRVSRCINKKVFDNYDHATFKSNILVSEDVRINDRKTIIADIELVQKWSDPTLYLQLIPKRCESL